MTEALYASTASGPYIWAEDGRRYFDGSSSALAAGLGHSHPVLVSALTSQATSLSFAHRTQFRSRTVEELKAVLMDAVPFSTGSCSLVSSGSDAIELAMKAALKFHKMRGEQKRSGFMARDLGYHGGTLGSGSLSGLPSRREAFAPLTVPVHRFPAPGGAASDANLADRVKASFADVEDGSLAAVITEVVSGSAGGVLAPPPGYLPLVRELCDQHGALLIFDEVMTGVGRTGTGFAFEHYDVQPDVLVFGKSISGGLGPLAGAIYSEPVAAQLGTFGGVGLGHTYMDAPLIAAAGLATARIVFQAPFLAEVSRLGDRLRQQLTSVANDQDCILDVRGVGLFNAVEFAVNNGSAESTTESVVGACREAGLLLYPGASDYRKEGGTSSVIVAPPLTVNAREIDELSERFASGVEIHTVATRR